MENALTTKPYDTFTDRLTHIKSHLAGGFSIEHKVDHIKNGTGDPQACVRGLRSHSLASAMNAWFGDKDLTATRQWFRESARLQSMALEMKKADLRGAGAWDSELLTPLVANDKELLDWFATHDFMFNKERSEDSKTADFLTYQAYLALRGDWARLEARCDEVIANPPKAKYLQDSLVDHQFYRALARGDEAGMQTAIAVLLTPKMLKAREDSESGFTQDLISTRAVIYTKLAWRHGFRFDPGSPLVPSEWLPLDPAPPWPSPYGI